MSEYSPRSRELASELRQKALRNLGASRSRSASSGQFTSKRGNGAVGDESTREERSK
jgi:hypothetical protein